MGYKKEEWGSSNEQWKEEGRKMSKVVTLVIATTGNAAMCCILASAGYPIPALAIGLVAETAIINKLSKIK